MLKHQPAFILHSRPYRETSVLLSLFTPELGKVSASLRGVRSTSKAARQKQAWLQPFQPLLLNWREGTDAQPDWVKPQNLEPNGSNYGLKADANICGLYLNELLYRLLQPGLGLNELFTQYQQTLFALSQSNERELMAWHLRQFELALLTELGYGLDLTQDAQGQSIEEAAIYRYQMQTGLYRIAPDADLSESITGACLLKLANQQFCVGCLSAWKLFLRRVLQPHLGVKPIATRALFN
ncbi:DNA repair protein RecO [Thiomicrospira microaerophila]|uniref:DNA repair protein RecO n=1 Tax=Thiomicrospira microaerophila TaxID=406020 RepID=UPI00200E0DEB|nr:DNA repair protein RecO [Thiomicrospira microaerophila]UQB43219.1 DNA repair protein RecO [Thiomicrospira microaerophila]